MTGWSSDCGNISDVRYRLTVVLIAAALAAACNSTPDAETIAMPDWEAAIDATRSISPVQVTTEVLVEVDDEPAGGAALSGIIDWAGGLADISPFEPITDTALSRIIINGETAYVLSSAQPFVQALPEGREIVEMPTADLRGLVPESPEHLTAALGLLRGASTARQRPSGEIEVDLDVARAWSALTDVERAGLGVSLDDIAVERALAEVTLSPDGHIERYRVRIEGSQDDREFLLTGAVEVDSVEGPLSFDPPPARLVVPIDDVPAVRALIVP